jgi:hypothetical protein
VFEVVLEWLISQLHLMSVLWLFPILYMFHDFEEILTVEKWTKHNKEQVLTVLPKSIRYFNSSFQNVNCSISERCILDLPYHYNSHISSRHFLFYYIFLMLLFIFFAHVFTHIGQVLYLKGFFLKDCCSTLAFRLS